MAGKDDEMFMTRSFDVTPKTTEQHLIARSNKSVTYVTNNKCIGDDTKAAARQSLNCTKNKKNNKIWRKTIFNITDGILTPCNVASSVIVTPIDRRQSVVGYVRHIVYS